MTDIVLRDIDATLRTRIDEVARRNGWTPSEALGQLLEAGLGVHEANRGPTLDGRENDVLATAISAMERLPSDPGFALIGRAPAP